MTREVCRVNRAGFLRVHAASGYPPKLTVKADTTDRQPIKKGTAPVSLLIKKGATNVNVSGLYTDFATREEVIRYIGEKLVAGM